jgi:5'(3')-deoxyribonucleotidase
MEILLDIDDVILHTIKSYLNFVYIQTGYKYTRRDITTWDLATVMPNLEKKNIINLMIQHASDRNSLLNIPPIENSIETINKLKEDNHNISLISSSIPDITPELTRAYRKNHLKQLFGKDFFHNIHLLSMGNKNDGHGNKSEVLRNYASKNSQLIYLDDSPTNYKHGLEAGIKNTFLFTAPWNASIEKVNRINNWEDFYKTVKALQSKSVSANSLSI